MATSRIGASPARLSSGPPLTSLLALVPELRGMKSIELVNGFECSGNSARAMQGLSSCGRFTGVRLSAVLKQLGVHPKAREVVCFGTDRGPLDIAFRQQTYKLEQHPLCQF